MLARRTLSSNNLRQRADGNGNRNGASMSRSAGLRQENINPSHLSGAFRSQPIVIGRNMTVYPTPGSPPPSRSSWDDTETLVDEPTTTTTTPDPRHFSGLAPQHVSDIHVRGRLTALRLRPGQQLGPIVYGNGRWVLHANPGRPTANTSNNSSSFAEQALTAILQRQPPTTSTTTADHQAERPNEQRREIEEQQRRRTEDAQIALVQHMLVSMGYSHARQRTLHYDELSALEQHELALRIVAEFGADATVAAAADAAAARLEEEERHEQRLREEEESAEEGCCTLREFENGVACERCMRWGGEIWEL